MSLPSAPLAQPASTMVQIDVQIQLDDLVDSLLLHVLSYLPLADCGRCGVVSSRWDALARDDGLWRGICAARFGAESATAGPSGERCDSAFEAARLWSEMSALVGLRHEPAPQLASLWQRATRTWGRLSNWAEEHLPLAAETLGPPATSTDWERALRRLELTAELCSPTHEPFLTLRLLFATHDGQHIASDALFAAGKLESHGDDEVGDLSDELRRVAMGPGGWYGSATGGRQGPPAMFLGLGGGFSAYDDMVSMRLLPLALVTAWTLYLRDKASVPHSMLAVGASYDMRRVLVYDLETGDLLLGPVRQSVGRCAAARLAVLATAPRTPGVTGPSLHALPLGHTPARASPVLHSHTHTVLHSHPRAACIPTRPHSHPFHTPSTRRSAAGPPCTSKAGCWGCCARSPWRRREDAISSSG